MANPNPKIEHLKKFQFKLGQTGNPRGRPKDTMKDFARKLFKTMSKEEKIEFLNSLSKDVVWRMAEGNPPQIIGGDPGKPIIIQISKEIAKKNKLNDSNEASK